ncbi:hypothetical protein [Rahnella selenatireducens]|uniref:hypothetical protein n=1 Tax=Rahnella selenatireducens TaxID=3389797 RepID=UPI003968108A
MKNRYHTVLWAVISGLSILALSLYYLYCKNNYFSCESELEIITHQGRYNVIMNYSFSRGLGRYHAIGVIQEKDKSELTVNKAFDFKYSRQGDSLVLMSVDNSPEPEQLDLLIPHLPDFFSYGGRGISVRLVKVNRFSYLFFHNNEPLFYCTRTDR